MQVYIELLIICQNSSMESGLAGFISINGRYTAFVARFTLCPCSLHNLVLKPPNSIGFVLKELEV